MSGDVTSALLGVSLVAPTPFDADEEVAFDQIGGLVDWAIARGVSALTVTGTSGEAFRLSDKERRAVVKEFCSASAGHIPVIAGAGHLSTVTAARLGQDLVAAGAAAILMPPPPVGTSSLETLTAHFDRVATAIDALVILQDDPINLGITLPARLICEMAERHENVAHAKLEELPSPPKIRSVLALSEGRVSCLGGSGGVYALEELAAGASGIMTGFCYPEVLIAALTAFRDHDMDRARTLGDMAATLARIESMPRVALSLRKHLYVQRGAIKSAVLRAPGVTADPWLLKLASSELRRVDQAWAASTR